MTDKQVQYKKIAKAIEYLDQNFKQQPNLEAVADHLNMSACHFQRLFKEWVGISPKKYLQFLTVNYSKSQLNTQRESLLNVAENAGLSGSGRLHDLFVNIEGMTPGEYKKGGQNLVISYSFLESYFGNILVASTSKGICYLAFIDDIGSGLEELKEQFPNAAYEKKSDEHQKNALKVFHNDWGKLNEIKLHLKGTDFQLKVWQALLTIPYGGLETYGQVAHRIMKPGASRAVGTAIGRNPIAYLIPCHRIIQSSGQIGGYRWNPIRKKAIIGWEAAKQCPDTLPSRYCD